MFMGISGIKTPFGSGVGGMIPCDEQAKNL